MNKKSYSKLLALGLMAAFLAALALAEGSPAIPAIPFAKGASLPKAGPAEVATSSSSSTKMFRFC
jgi:hypothetical protein